jgi:hypothetical protein
VGFGFLLFFEGCNHAYENWQSLFPKNAGWLLYLLENVLIWVTRHPWKPLWNLQQLQEKNKFPTNALTVLRKKPQNRKHCCWFLIVTDSRNIDYWENVEIGASKSRREGCRFQTSHQISIVLAVLLLLLVYCWIYLVAKIATLFNNWDYQSHQFRHWEVKSYDCCKCCHMKEASFLSISRSHPIAMPSYKIVPTELVILDSRFVGVSFSWPFLSSICLWYGGR